MSGAATEHERPTRKRGRVSFASDAFTESTSLSSLPDGGPSQRRISLDELAHNPLNPRYGYDDPQTQELATSLKLYGQLQEGAVVARDVYLAHWPQYAEELGSAPWVVMIGNRRLAAARLIGLTHLNFAVRDRLGGADPMLAEIALIENIHRADLPPLLEARELQGLVERHGSQGKVAERLAKSQGWVSQRLALLKLTPELQEQLRAGELTVREARSIASLPADQQRDRLVELRTKTEPSEPAAESARGVDEDRADSPEEPGTESDTGERKRPDVLGIARRLRRQLSHDELDALVEALTTPHS